MDQEIYIKLTSANMGNVSESDFDAWAAFVIERLPKEIGHDVMVDQYRFGEGFEDEVEGPDELVETVRECLSHTLWDEFCSTPEAWVK